MFDLFNRSLLILFLSMALLPQVTNAAHVGADSALSQPQTGATDTLSGQIPGAPQSQELKYHEMAPLGSPAETSGDPGSQKTKAPASAHKEQIKVVYDQETEKDRGTLITLIIAFGISLALNIYLATSLISARRGMS